MRDDIEADMRELLGGVPSIFERTPDELLPAEWELTRRLQFGETLIPSRYKELVGVAVAAATRCPYGVLLHSELAGLHGATEAEVAEAVRLAALASSLGAQLAGLGIPPERFAAEARRTAAHMADRLGD